LGTRGLPPDCTPPQRPAFGSSVALFFILYTLFV
jgi:hypothetical protein